MRLSIIPWQKQAQVSCIRQKEPIFNAEVQKSPVVAQQTASFNIVDIITPNSIAKVHISAVAVDQVTFNAPVDNGTVTAAIYYVDSATDYEYVTTATAPAIAHVTNAATIDHLTAVAAGTVYHVTTADSVDHFTANAANQVTSAAG